MTNEGAPLTAERPLRTCGIKPNWAPLAKDL